MSDLPRDIDAIAPWPADPAAYFNYEFGYDGLGRRVWTQSNSGNGSWFIYDGDQLVQERDFRSDALIVEYAWGPTTGAPAIFYQRRIVSSTPEERWIYTSPQGGFPRHLFDDTGALTDTFQYSSFGELVFHEGTTEVDFGARGTWRFATDQLALSLALHWVGGYVWIPSLAKEANSQMDVSGAATWAASLVLVQDRNRFTPLPGSSCPTCSFLSNGAPQGGPERTKGSSQYVPGGTNGLPDWSPHYSGWCVFGDMVQPCNEEIDPSTRVGFHPGCAARAAGATADGGGGDIGSGSTIGGMDPGFSPGPLSEFAARNQFNSPMGDIIGDIAHWTNSRICQLAQLKEKSDCACSCTPAACELGAYGYGTAAMQAAKTLFPETTTNCLGDACDAFRHCYWACLMEADSSIGGTRAELSSLTCAEFILEGHEKQDEICNPTHTASRAMDRHNNAEGIACARFQVVEPYGDCMSCCLTKGRSGLLKIP